MTCVLMIYYRSAMYDKLARVKNTSIHSAVLLEPRPALQALSLATSCSSHTWPSVVTMALLHPSA